MERSRTRAKIRAVFLCAFVGAVCLFAVTPLSAYAQGSPKTGEIVFVLDASNSMNTNDPGSFEIAKECTRKVKFTTDIPLDSNAFDRNPANARRQIGKAAS